MVQHIVMWNFKPEVNKEEVVKTMQQIFASFSADVPGMSSLQVYQGFQGYDACLISHHENEEALEIYQNFPGHLEAKKYVHSVIEQRASCDFVY